jgi:hypothetical protein
MSCCDTYIICMSEDILLLMLPEKCHVIPAGTQLRSLASSNVTSLVALFLEMNRMCLIILK